MTAQVVIDWSVFDQYPESTCDCRCGARFRSHAKVVRDKENLVTVTRKPCPDCNENDNCNRVRSDPERYVIRGGDDT